MIDPISQKHVVLLQQIAEAAKVESGNPPLSRHDATGQFLGDMRRSHAGGENMTANSRRTVYYVPTDRGEFAQVVRAAEKFVAEASRKWPKISVFMTVHRGQVAVTRAATKDPELLQDFRSNIRESMFEI